MTTYVAVFSVPGGKKITLTYADVNVLLGLWITPAGAPSVNFSRGRDTFKRSAGLKHASFLCRWGFSQNSDTRWQLAASRCYLRVKR